MHYIIISYFAAVILLSFTYSQRLVRKADGDWIISKENACMDCSSLNGAVNTKGCSCKCSNGGTVLPRYGALGCFSPSKTSIALLYGCSLNLLSTESSIPSLGPEKPVIQLLSFNGQQNLGPCIIDGQSSLHWTANAWRSLFTNGRYTTDFDFETTPEKTVIKWMGQPTAYNGLLVKLGMSCKALKGSLLVKFHGDTPVEENLAALIKLKQNAETQFSRNKREIPVNGTAGSNQTGNQQDSPITDTGVPKAGFLEAPRNAALNGTKEDEGENSRVLLYLAMVCGSALFLVAIPVVVIIIKNARRQRKNKRHSAAVKRFADENGNSPNGVFVIRSDGGSKASTITVNIDDGLSSRQSSVKSSRRGSLDPAAINDLRRFSMNYGIRMHESRLGSLADLRDSSRPSSRRGSLPALEHRPRSLNDMKPIEPIDMRRPSLSSPRMPSTPEFRRNISSDSRLQRLTPNLLREIPPNMEEIEESENEFESDNLRKISISSLRGAVSMSDLPEVGNDQLLADTRYRSRTLSKLLGPEDMANAIGANRYSPRYMMKSSEYEDTAIREDHETMEKRYFKSSEPKEQDESLWVKEATLDPTLPYAPMALPTTNSNCAIPDKDYEDEVFDKLGTPDSSHHTEPSYTKYCIS